MGLSEVDMKRESEVMMGTLNPEDNVGAGFAKPGTVRCYCNGVEVTRPVPTETKTRRKQVIPGS